MHTTAHIVGSRLGVGHKHDIYNTVYLPSHPSMVLSCIEQWRTHCTEKDPPIEAYTFVDLGCGMGRAVMVASDLPFARVIGVEMNPGLCEQARKNLAIWQKHQHVCAQLEIANTEASEFAWPKGPVAVYMFNPFEAPVVEALLQVLEEAVKNGSGPVDILYVYPAFTEVFDSHPKAELMARTHSFLSEEDRLIDPYNNPAEERYSVDLHIYRLLPEDANTN
ncbi:MAG TPA: class I SAM-dependent methyltransferase [Acidobacteriaceae bacterium]|nr:class I SAM-dependent methyltransferase [Acidobacteriaceae bacterium]